jgi:alpha-galactosidase
MPNRGQVANLPLGAVVETNVRFSEGAVTPLMAGNIPLGVLR